MRVVTFVYMAGVVSVLASSGACGQHIGQLPPPAGTDAAPVGRAAPRTEAPSAMAVVMQPMRGGIVGPDAPLLAQLRFWRDQDANAAAARQNGPAPLELMRLEAEAGNYAEALRQADRMSGAPPAPSGPDAYPADGWAAVDALPAIVALAEHRQVVMINEADTAWWRRACERKRTTRCRSIESR